LHFPRIFSIIKRNVLKDGFKVNESEKIGTIPDLNITTILAVNKTTTSNWMRPFPVPRATNGLVFLTGGSIEYNIGGVKETASPGSILKFPKGLQYTGVKLTAQNSYYVIDFETVNENEMADFPLPYIFPTVSLENTEKEFKILYDLWNSTLVSSKLNCKSKLYGILSNLLIDYSLNNGYSPYTNRVLHIIEYIHKNYYNPNINVESLCAHFNISESQMRRIFQKSLKLSPLKYIQSVRISHAKDMLCYDNASIEDVAFNCGYSSLYYFSRVFKQITGYNPSKFSK